MGTLFKQSAREVLTDYEAVLLDDAVTQIMNMVKEHRLTVEQATNIYFKVKELEFKVDDRNRYDEQLAGFGELLDGLVGAIEAFNQ